MPTFYLLVTLLNTGGVVNFPERANSSEKYANRPRITSSFSPHYTQSSWASILHPGYNDAFVHSEKKRCGQVNAEKKEVFVKWFQKGKESNILSWPDLIMHCSCTIQTSLTD